MILEIIFTFRLERWSKNTLKYKNKLFAKVLLRYVFISFDFCYSH